jgi:tRNA-specific 2-thiouridylase
VAEKPDSVEICFVPGDDYRAFVQERVAPVRGELRDASGAVLAEHAGIAAYTVGQRRGLGIAAGEPRYVTAIDAAANVVVVGPEEDLFADAVEVEGVSWVAGYPPSRGAALEAKARYRAEPTAAALLDEGDGHATVRFERPQRALTPGQAIALYRGEEVLGGGTIVRAWRR